MTEEQVPRYARDDNEEQVHGCARDDDRELTRENMDSFA